MHPSDVLQAAGFFYFYGSPNVVANAFLSQPEDNVGDKLLGNAHLVRRLLRDEDEVATTVSGSHDLRDARASGRNLAIGIKVPDQGFKSFNSIQNHQVGMGRFDRREKRQHAIDEAPIVPSRIGGEVDEADFRRSALMVNRTEESGHGLAV